ncbi:uncharacterized protein F4822DRAFT_284165 [Hypoxylon trugodes]|uniref:uncharacterized protein n=1 Tax=Hypoxylon trugodes TaxID=326681 RepID=UPI0021A1DD51|nr:uncharacterized protein F4822DRAFT_284165 [Hypoxylon trugodes]KAI1387486.1 hypothetical protein F4822DRAFT_284165 [Hypoxylon trugodes]
MSGDNFNKKCLDYFIQKYGERIDDWSRDNDWSFELSHHYHFRAPTRPKPYALPEGLDSKTLPYLVNDRPFYFACKVLGDDPISTNSLVLGWYLWEAFGTRPTEFLELYMSLKSKAISDEVGSNRPVEFTLCTILQKIFQPGSRPTLEWFYLKVSDLAGGTQHQSYHKEFQTMKSKLEDLRNGLERQGFGSTWTTRNNPPGSNWETYNDRYNLPLFNGLCQYIWSQREGQVRKLLQSFEKIPDQRSPIQNFKGGFLSINITENGGIRNTNNPQYEDWGLYLMTSNDAEAESNQGNALVEPIRRSAPRGIHPALEDLIEWETAGLPFEKWDHGWDEGYGHFLGSKTDATALLVAWWCLFNLCRDKENLTLWTSLQNTSSAQHGISNAVYRLSRLVPCNDDFLYSVCRFRGWDKIFVHESQAVSSNPIVKAYQQHLIIFGYELRPGDDREHAPTHDNFDDITNEEKFGKTLHDHVLYVLKKAHKSQQPHCRITAHPFFFRTRKSSRSLTELLKKNDWDEVRRVVVEWDLFTKSELKTINNGCVFFFGRFRWVTIFAEELLCLSSTTKGRLTAEEFSTTSYGIVGEIKSSFKQWIRRIKDMAWANDLFRIAIYTEVFGVFEDTEDIETTTIETTAQSILTSLSLGDTYVSMAKQGPQVLRDYLGEPLFLRAVTEHLQESKKYGSLMEWLRKIMGGKSPNKLLKGKLSELIIAIKLDRILRLSSTATDKVSIGQLHRRSFWKKLLDAKRWNLNSKAWISVREEHVDLDLYELQDAGPSDPIPSHSVRNIKEWLAEQKRSTFLFPDKGDGTNLLFFLRRKSGSSNDRPSWPEILCSIRHMPSTHPKDEDVSKIPKMFNAEGLGSGQRGWPVIHIFVANKVSIWENACDQALKAMRPTAPQISKTLQIEKLPLIIERVNGRVQIDEISLNRTLDALRTEAKALETSLQAGVIPPNLPLIDSEENRKKLGSFVRPPPQPQGDEGRLKYDDFVCYVDSNKIWGESFHDLMELMARTPSQ